MEDMSHVPVLQKEVLQYLAPEPNENFIDCTIGGGGHTLAILEKNGPKGKVLGIDFDAEVLQNTKYKIQNTEYKNRVILVCNNFSNLKEIIKKEKFSKVSGILFDLGMSSWHLEESGRGFSFLRKELLDMRFNPPAPKGRGSLNKIERQNPLTAEKILNFWSELDIEKTLREFAEERFSQRIAEEIVRERKVAPIKSTFQLVEIVKKATPSRYHHQKLHPATKTFQALRIAVNDELNNLNSALPQALEILEKGGRLVVISFHSLEDKIVKDFYRGRTSVELKIVNKKPVIPSFEEIKINPRSRSAKLRAAIKII